MALHTVTAEVEALLAAGWNLDQIKALTDGRFSKNNAGEWETSSNRNLYAIKHAVTELEMAKKRATQITWAKLRDGSWGIAGRGLVEGAEVTVTRRNGSTSTEVVGQIIETRGDMQLARIAPKSPLARTASYSRGYRIQDGGEIWDYA